MKIVDIPEFNNKADVLCIPKDIDVYSAVEKMVEKNYGSCLITENRKVLGIFTERDLMKKVIAKNLDPKKTKIADIMTKDIRTARKDDDVFECLVKMSNGRFRHLPIVDEKDEVVGILSQGDFVAHTWNEIFLYLREKTKANFFENTQLWMIVIAALAYLTIMVYFFAG